MNIQRINTQNDLDQFLNFLGDLYKNRKGLYFFRGLRNSDYKLLPGAFRPGDIRNRELLFNGSRAHILARRDEAKNIVLGHFNGDLQLTRQFMNHIEYQRLIDIIAFITRYNFPVSSFVHENRTIHDTKSVEALSYRPVACWLTDESFYLALEEYLRGLEFQISLDGKELLKQPYILNDITPYDESLAQHYCERYPTTILDWTYNPYIALYFALPKNHKTVNHLYFSICVCEKPTQNDGQVFFLEDYQEFNTYNLRIRRQEGLFSQMRPPISFYYFKGFWPSVEDLLSFNEYIRVTRYNIQVSFTEDIRTILNNMGYNQEFLLPPLEVQV